MGLKYAIHRVDGNAAELYAYAEQKGFSVARIGRPVDAIFGKYGFTVACEIKRPKAPRRANEAKQRAFMESFKGARVILRDTNDIDELDRLLRLDRVRLQVP
jgi:hypothetical protein